jgi:hypothetical protein
VGCLENNGLNIPERLTTVFSCGNYRKELFLYQGTGKAFERCLFEAVRIAAAGSFTRILSISFVNSVTSFAEEIFYLFWVSRTVWRECEDTRSTWDFLRRAILSAEMRRQSARVPRARTTAGNPWIAKRLKMGHPSRVTNLIRELASNE